MPGGHAATPFRTRGWSRPELADADSGSTLIKVGLVLVAGVVFFLLVGG